MPGDDQAMIVILDYPGAQRSAILGMQDMFAFARQHALVQGGSFPDATARELPPKAALRVTIRPALILSPPALPDGWGTRPRSLHLLPVSWTIGQSARTSRWWRTEGRLPPFPIDGVSRRRLLHSRPLQP